MISNDASQQLVSKVAWRLIPFLCLLYVFNIIDRSNLGFARLTMQDDLNLSEAVFNFGYGIFYLGYLVFEVPSNLVLKLVGARRWIARIMITWGFVSACTMFVTDEASFYAVRILLGVAEAGFFPGIVLYLTYWFTARERARIVALFMGAIAFAQIFGNPVSGAVMEFMDGLLGLKGWQWVFLLEGLPSVALGFVVYWYLPDGPDDAKWLTSGERSEIKQKLTEESIATGSINAAKLKHAFLDYRVWYLIAIYAMVAIGANASGAYFPKEINSQFPERTKFDK